MAEGTPYTPRSVLGDISNRRIFTSAFKTPQVTEEVEEVKGCTLEQGLLETQDLLLCVELPMNIDIPEEATNYLEEVSFEVPEETFQDPYLDLLEAEIECYLEL